MAKPARRKVRVHIGRRIQPSSSKKLPLSGIFLVIVLALAAFGAYQFLTQTNPNAAANDNNNNNMYQPPEGLPQLLIISPQNGDVFRSSSVGIRVNVTNFRLADIVANRPNLLNEGHLLFVLDGREQRGVYKVTSFANVPKGDHTLTVYLENNDKTHYTEPPVYQIVTFKTE